MDHTYMYVDFTINIRVVHVHVPGPLHILKQMLVVPAINSTSHFTCFKLPLFLSQAPFPPRRVCKT